MQRYVHAVIYIVKLLVVLIQTEIDQHQPANFPDRCSTALKLGKHYSISDFQASPSSAI